MPAEARLLLAARGARARSDGMPPARGNGGLDPCGLRGPDATQGKALREDRRRSRQGLPHTGRPATAALADPSRSQCRRRTRTFSKNKGHLPHGIGAAVGQPSCSLSASCRAFLNAAERSHGNPSTIWSEQARPAAVSRLALTSVRTVSRASLTATGRRTSQRQPVFGNGSASNPTCQEREWVSPSSKGDRSNLKSGLDSSGSTAFHSSATADAHCTGDETVTAGYGAGGMRTS
jgi:hypothetical protein